MAVRPAVFIDRDGTIIVDQHYLSTPSGIRYKPGVMDGLLPLKKHGFRLFIVSNQSGVGRGYFSLERLMRINRRIEMDFHELGVSIDAIEYCPHHPNERCNCRKPGSYMFEKLLIRFRDVLPQCSFAVGDSIRDILPAKKLGIHTVLISDGVGNGEADFVTPDFGSAVNWILARWRELRCLS